MEVEIGRKKSAGSVASTSSVDRQAGEAVEQQEPPGQGFSRVHTNSGGSRITRQVESAEGGARDCRAFTIVCPAARVRMNIKTCLKDSETGRVALQWCLASKEGGERGRGRCTVACYLQGELQYEVDANRMETVYFT